MTGKVRIWISVALSLGAIAPVLAHHSFAMFDANKTVTITGTIKTFEWINPHAWIWVLVSDDKGAQELYGLETAGTGMLRRMGITRDTFKAGSKVTMDIHPLRSGEKGGEWVRATMADGTVLDAKQLRDKYSSGG
jgi:hypothetical protein